MNLLSKEEGLNSTMVRLKQSSLQKGRLPTVSLNSTMVRLKL